MQGNGHQEGAKQVFEQMTLIRHLSIAQVADKDDKSVEEDEEEAMGGAIGTAFEDAEEHKGSPEGRLLLLDDKKSLSEEDINETEH